MAFLTHDFSKAAHTISPQPKYTPERGFFASSTPYMVRSNSERFHDPAPQHLAGANPMQQYPYHILNGSPLREFEVEVKRDSNGVKHVRPFLFYPG
jgi:hypothetical protein